MNEEKVSAVESAVQDNEPKAALPQDPAMRQYAQQPIPQQTVLPQFAQQQIPPQQTPPSGAAVTTELSPDVNADISAEVDDAQLFAEKNAEAEMRIAQQQEQDEKLLAALDEVLEKRSKQISAETKKRTLSKSKKAAATVASRGIGFVSLGIILIFMGIVMIATLSAATPNYTIPLKLSPICAVLIGAEILIHQVMTHGRPRVHIPSVLISVLVVGGCCFLCAKLGGDYKEETELFNNRSIAGQIYDKSYKELKGLADIASLNVDVNLNPDGGSKLKGIEALSASDTVNVKVAFGGVYNSPEDFAGDCKKIIDSYRLMGLYVTNFRFSNESSLRSYTLDVEGKFAQDYNKDKLEEMVNYFYVDDYDYIEDLDDYTETSDNTSTSSD